MNDSPELAPLKRKSVDLNADLGEGFPNDRAMLERVTSASICCGAHAGSVEVIRRTLRDARALGVVVGGHPGYRDREAFGRREQKMTTSEVRALLADQMREIDTLAREAGARIAFLKPHGALYNQAQHQPAIALAVAATAAELSLPLLGLPGTLLERLTQEHGAQFVPEGFIDRRYRPDGALVPRTEPGAVLEDPDEIAAQVVRLAREGRVATLCIHGDDPRALANVELARQALAQAGIAVRSFVGELA